MRRATTAKPYGRMLETACWSAGVLLTAMYFGTRAYGEVERRQAVSSFTQARSVAPDQTHWSASRIRAYAVPALSAESAPLPAALLRIRRVGLEVPVYADTSERNLNRGGGLIAGTGVPDGDGNVAIAAHRDGYFRALEHVVVGDVLELDSLSRQRRYRVTELAIVAPTDMSPLDDVDAPAVTLVTCYPFYFAGAAPQRYIVRALEIY